jgi:hypothetical protein
MLDWFTGRVGYNASALKLGEVLAVNPGGEIEWRKERPVSAQGSYSSKVLVGRGSSTVGMRECAERDGLLVSSDSLWLSGNPVKFLQGHNVFGPSASSLGSLIRSVIRKLPDGVRPSDADSELWASMQASRCDLTVMVDLGSHASVHEWLRDIGSISRTRHGRPLVSGATVTWGRGSRRWSFVAYCKFCELAAHPFDDLRINEQLREFVEGQVRLEVRLHGLELKGRGVPDESWLWQYFERVEIGGLEMEKLVSGRPVLRPVVELCFGAWMSGKDVGCVLPRRTFYKYRREILDSTGIDISIPRSEQEIAVEKAHFDIEYLKEHEVNSVPSGLQGFLFRPEKCPSYSF